MRMLLPFLILFISAESSYAQDSDITQYIAEYTTAHDFSGDILIERDNDIAYHEQFGLANCQFRVPVGDSTVFKIASITKLFTAVLVMQLYEEGRIDLNRTIDAYLPDYAGEGALKVTIRQLLNHTSGIANMDTLTSQESAIRHGVPHYQSPHTTGEMLVRYASGPLVHEPGTVFSYNNADYIILGKIIESLRGRPYDEVLRERILQPLGMGDTGMAYQYEIMENLADTYFVRNDLGALVNDLPAYIENWYAAGGMYSTAADLLTFSNALFGYRLVRRETLDLMLTPGLDDYGFSVWVDSYDIGGEMYTAIKRPGSIMGAQAMLLHFMNTDLTIIIMANTDTTDLDAFVLDIAGELLAGN